MSDLVPLLSHVSIYEAHGFRNLLAADNIEAVVDGEVAAGMLSYMGTAVDARLLVERTDLERAARILADAKEQAQTRSISDWFCGHCQEIVDGGFEACWSCGGVQSDVQDSTVDLQALQNQANDGVAISDSEPGDSEPGRFPVTRSESLEPLEPIDTTNPYAVPQVTAESAPSPSTPPTPTFSPATSLQLKRAWRSAALAVAFFPLHVYSVYLLMTLPIESEWPPEESQKFYLAWILNGLIFAVWAVLAKLSFGGF